MTRLRDADGVQGKIDAFKIDPRSLEVDPDYNIRDLDAPDERALLDWLKDSIRTNGVQEALRVRMDGERCLIVRGHRRHRAVMELIAEGVEIKNLLCLQEPQGTTDLERDLDLVLSNTQERPKPIQFANLIYRIINVHGLTEEECAERISRPIETIRRHLELRAAPEQVKEMVRAGEVSATTAVREVRKNGSAAVETLTKAKADAKAAGKDKVTPKRLQASKAPAPKEEPKIGPINVVTTTPIERPGPEDIEAGEAAALLDIDSHQAKSEASLYVLKPEVAKSVVETLRPFARLWCENSTDDLGSSHTLPVEVNDLQRAAITFAKLTGGLAP